MSTNRNSTSATRRRLIILTWLCLVSSFSLATPVPPCPSSCECRLDNSELLQANCTDAQWHGVAFPHIRALLLTPSDIGCSISQNASLLFPQLESISLRNCSLTTLPSDAFRHFKSLQQVDLSHNSLSHLSPSLFADNTKLRYLNLEHNALQHLVLWSDTVWEVNLAHCNLGSQLPAKALAGLPNLRYLSLANNSLETIPQNSLPAGLRKLDLSGNHIVDVPVSELHRLKGLKEINISGNPVNCTCELMGFQNWISSESTVFQIWCATPVEYAGYSLVDVPQSRLCNVDKWPENTQDLGERFGHVATDQDDFLFDVEIDKVVGQEGAHRHTRRSAKQPAQNTDVPEGSGAGLDDVEGSGAEEDEVTTIASTESRNESAFLSLGANATELSSSNKSTSEVESSSLTTISSSSSDSSSQSSIDVSSDLNDLSRAIAADVTTAQKESESTNVTDASPINQEITTPADVLEGGNSSAKEGNGKVSESDLITTSSTEASSPDKVEDTVAQAVPAEIANPADQIEPIEHPTTTTQSVAQSDTESASVSEPSITLEKAHDLHPVVFDQFPKSVEEGETTIGANKKRDDDFSINSTGQPLQGQMTKDETMKTASGTPYIIPSLLIVAVALVCLAIYFSQHNCRSKSWNRNDAKANGPSTELQDMSLLRVESRPSDAYSSKYEAEGRTPQTEKLTNGDGAGEGDYPVEENGTLLADHRLPPVRKSTTRVTTNYESLPKTPIIIQKS